MTVTILNTNSTKHTQSHKWELQDATPQKPPVHITQYKIPDNNFKKYKSYYKMIAPSMTHTIHNKSYENKYQTKNIRYAHAMKALE